MPTPVPHLDSTVLDQARAEHATSAPLMDQLERAAAAMSNTFATGGIVFLAGNGGSMADALHIAGELKKSFERPRPLPGELHERLESMGAGELARSLQGGLRVVVLGADPVLATAVDNDLPERHVLFAQELVSLGRPGDLFFAISTSGRSPNILHAACVARALDLTVVVLTGRDPAPELVDLADVLVAAPATGTAKVQLWHGRLYHLLCGVLEDTFFPEGSDS